MEDVFYLNKTKIKPTQLYELIKNACPKYPVYLSTPVKGYMRHGVVIQLENTSIWFTFISDSTNSSVYQSMSEKTREVFDEINPKTFIIVTYRPSLHAFLIEVLESIMKISGGVVGCDDDWNTMFSLETIKALNCGY